MGRGVVGKERNNIQVVDDMEWRGGLAIDYMVKWEGIVLDNLYFHFTTRYYYILYSTCDYRVNTSSTET